MLLRDGDERDHGAYNERSEGWEDRRGGGGSHQQSLLRPSYLGGGGLNFVVKDLVKRILFQEEDPMTPRSLRADQL